MTPSAFPPRYDPPSRERVDRAFPVSSSGTVPMTVRSPSIMACSCTYPSGILLLFCASQASKVCSAGFRARETARLRAPQ